MEELSLNVQDRAQLIGFLAQWSGFAPAEIKVKAEALIQAYDDGQKTDKAELAAFVERLAREVWPARYALKRFFNEEGALIEWDRVEQAVRKSTAHLMERFRRGTDVQSLDQMLDHEDFDMTFREEESHEIQEVRHHVSEDYWNGHPKTLEPLLAEGRIMVEGCRKRLDEMKSLAPGWPSLLAEELLAKVKSLEDRIFFRGEHIPLETLDEELAYYREQKALPIGAEPNL